ncbi:MAG: acyl-CoA thioesterase [Anaerolineales bacterium]|jgi:acyl-CoA thioester hydrolase
MENFPFKLTFEVRDYECDLSGIVNNAVYQHYLEHARHKYLKTRGIDFAALEEQGITLVVVRIEIDFLFPLRSGDKFYVYVTPERISRLRFGFQQEIYRLPDEKQIIHAKVIGTALNDQGSPRIPAEVEELLFSRLEIDQG